MVLKRDNPVLSGFYPDPSICRVGEDFYLVNSTFAYFPGIPVFHSRDLVHWRQIGNAIDRPGQLRYDGHQVSQGLFAPAIRENKGVFYIVCTLIKNGGNFVITANDPAGPWSDPVWLVGAQGIDPSLFFDDDQRVWYCGTRSAPEGEAFPGNGDIYIHEIDLSLLAEGKNPLIGESISIWRGALLNAVWPEGPHIYKIGSWYYLLNAEGGTGLDHAVCVARAKDIHGPWEGKKSNPVITHRHLGKNAGIINVGHADLFDCTNGNWYMVLLASRPFEGVCPLGRETFIVPIRWEDEWPFIASESGMIEDTAEIDAGNREYKSGSFFPQECACDHFNGKLPLYWLTLRMPSDAKDAAFNFSGRGGALRLLTRAQTIRELEHCAFAGRRLRHRDWAFCALMEFAPNSDIETAGIILFQSEDWHYRFEVCSVSGNPSLRLVRAGGKEDEILKTKGNPSHNKQIVLAACCENMKLSFFFGKDNYTLDCFADNIDARILSTEYAGGFTGSFAGVYASGNGKNTGNYADIIWAEYRGL